ncbi:MAG: 3'(2'),5'-bisphosphate nucleotidase CysQ [Bacilli bacterium]|nr:3'(2'),5'-bisphosphate nucleotidase CysQ [Bacilli bacterium]
MSYEKELAAIKRAALESEKVILEIYNTDFDVEIKSDDSPVTAADKAADKLIREILHEEFPHYAFLTEESKDDKSRLNNEFVIIVDPVDGTKDFVSKDGQFTTNIALCRNHEIVVGLINAPTLGVMYYAIKGEGAYRLEKGKEPIRLHVSDKTDSLRVLRSISFFNEKEKKIIDAHMDKIGEIIPVGAALKFCKIAEGSADLSYRESSNTKEWDTAAGTIIVKEAGGVVLKHDLTEYTYNRDDVYNRDGYVIANKVENILL